MKHTTQNGYAILFAVVIISVISVIAFGLSNSTYKQLVLSSVASNSQLAFFQSDTATECALYADRIINVAEQITDPTDTISYECGRNFNNLHPFEYRATRPYDTLDGQHVRFILRPASPVLTEPCSEVDVTEDTTATPVPTRIKARGYNSCDKSSLKTVEREIKVTY